MEKIKQAAILLENGEVLSVAPPSRHPSIILMAKNKGFSLHNSVQGFLTTMDRFIDRKDGFRMAERNNQIRHKPMMPGTLYTEDLW